MEEFSSLLGGDKYVSASSVLPSTKYLAKYLESNDDDPTYISDIKNYMKNYFLERCESNLNYDVLTKCTALDPRYKSLKALVKEKQEEVWERLLEEDEEHGKRQQK